jgi:hypothetical protein
MTNITKKLSSYNLLIEIKRNNTSEQKKKKIEEKIG